MSDRPYLPGKRFSLARCLKTHPSFPHPFAALQTEVKPTTALVFAAAPAAAALASSPSASCRRSVRAFVDCIKQGRNKSKTNSNHSELPQTQ